MLLDEKDVFPIIKFWARLYCRNFKSVISEPDELFNIVYLGKIQQVNDIKFASNAIRQDIIDYLRHEKRHNREYLIEDIEALDLYEYVSGDSVCNKFPVSLDKIIDRAFLTSREKSILYLYYYQENTMDEIATILGVTKSLISTVHSSILAKLREAAKNEQESDGTNESVHRTRKEI